MSEVGDPFKKEIAALKEMTAKHMLRFQVQAKALRPYLVRYVHDDKVARLSASFISRLDGGFLFGVAFITHEIPFEPVFNALMTGLSEMGFPNPVLLSDMFPLYRENGEVDNSFYVPSINVQEVVSSELGEPSFMMDTIGPSSLIKKDMH